MTAATATGTRATHYGPTPKSVGGMGAVLELYAEHSIGADEVRAVGTYVPESRPASAWETLRALAGLLRFDRQHVVHVHLSDHGAFIREGAIVLASSLLRRPTAISIHGGRFPAFVERHPGLVAAVLRRADVVVVLTEGDRERIEAVAPEVETELIPNPTPVDTDAPPVRETGEVVLFAGVIGPHKGVDVLVEAWRQVVERRPQARCIVVGPSVIDTMPTAERLEFRPPADRATMRALMHEARLVVLPSRREVLPMVLTEAMGAARPFVATPVGGIPSLAPGGLLVPVEDAGALADAMTRLLADPDEAEALGRRGQELIRNTRDIAESDHRLRALYDRVRAARRGRR
jgi:glycosyltransferase involved in cell wall biosynthesis